MKRIWILLLLAGGCQRAARPVPPAGAETVSAPTQPDTEPATEAADSQALRLPELASPIDDPFVEVSLGRDLGCARRESGRIACWRSDDPVLREVPDVADARSISTHDGEVCAIRGAAQSLQCWDVIDRPPSPYITRPELDGVAWLERAPVAHGSSSCAGRTTGETVCWEWDALNTKAIGEQLSLPKGLKGLSFGWAHWCGHMADDTMQCWGANGRGQLGPGAKKAPMPSADWIPEADVRGAVAPIGKLRSMATGSEFTCAADTSGDVTCWGTDYEGVLGDGPNKADVGTPVKVARIADAVQLDAGQAFACAREADGQVWCWGANYYGQLGEGSAAHHSPEPVLIEGFEATDIDLYWDRACATTSKGHVACWGNHHSPTQPQVVRSLTQVEELTTCKNGTCARRDDGTVLCWGDFLTGPEADPTRFRDPTPVDAAKGLTGLTAFCDGPGWKVCGQADGDVRCVGSKVLDEPAKARTLTQADTGESRVFLAHLTGAPWPCVVDNGGVSCFTSEGTWPVEGAPALQDVLDIEIHGDAMCWVTRAGTAECAELERDDDRQRLVLEDRRPQPLTDLEEITTTLSTACARDSGQRVHCWRPFGDVAPTLAAEGIAALGPPGCGITTKGEARCWSRPFMNTPESVASNAKAMVVGSDHGCVLHPSGTVSCWGDNSVAQLGDGRGGGLLWGVPVELAPPD